MINHGPRFLWVAVVYPNGRMLHMRDNMENTLWKLGWRNSLGSIRRQVSTCSFIVLKDEKDTPDVYRVYSGADLHLDIEELPVLKFRDEDAAIMCAIMKARQ